jgi:hypothetical protein
MRQNWIEHLGELVAGMGFHSLTVVAAEALEEEVIATEGLWKRVEGRGGVEEVRSLEAGCHSFGAACLQRQRQRWQ